MKLKSLLPVAFGKFHARQPILLEDGLNIITGDNESGKSTLAAFISGMLYGFKKEGLTRISRTPEFERYRPWVGQEYRGIMVYEADGRAYRVERWFDPDIVKIYDDITGEDITYEFAQDSRKEHNFPQVHLGLSAKEFRNTIWIGQLGSTQDGDLGLEIQGKLENILQGSEEDLPFTKALSVLNQERGKIKTPRSTRAKLDVIQQQKAELTGELEEARLRESQIRKTLVELRRLRQDEADVVQKAQRASRRVDCIRAVLLGKVVFQARQLKQQICRLEDSLRLMEWAKHIPDNLQEDLQGLIRNQEDIDARISETEAEIRGLAGKKQGLVDRLKQYRPVLSTGLSQDQVSGLYSKYLTCKAGAARGERHANETRRALRRLEEQAKNLGISHMAAGEDLLAEAEGFRDVVVLSEREKSRLDVEIEKAKAGLAQTNVTGAGGWLYALSLGVLGIAIALTIMGLPMAVPAFGISIVVFGIGSYRHRKALSVRSQAEEEYNLAVARAEEQSTRVAQARKELHDFLELQGVTSVENLRLQVQEISEFNRRLMNSKDQYDLAHRYWYESSQELSVIERELVSALARAGCLARGQAVTDGAVALLKTKLRESAEINQEMNNIDYRMEEFKAILSRFEARKEQLQQAEGRLLEAAGVASVQELHEMIAVHERYVDTNRSLGHLREKLGAVLSGRDLGDLEAELRELENGIGAMGLADFGAGMPINMGDGPAGGVVDGVAGEGRSSDDLSEKDHQDAQRQLSRIRSGLSEIRERKASMEKETVLRQREGRPVYAIEEDLARVTEVEKELTQDKEALDLALKALEELSRNLRREFAPMLNERAGEILRQITDGRYVDVRVSPDLDMSVIHPGDKSQTPIEGLSCGTVDQCYFALRVAVAELIVTREVFPFFLDDSFVQYDDKRLEGALKIISELSRRHQILLFSCHGRERTIAQRVGIQCNIVSLNDAGELETGT